MQPQHRAKNELFIGATVQPIQNCELLSSCQDSTLFISKRSLIIMNLTLRTMKSCLIEQQKIISATYYTSLEIFIINTDRYLIILNKQAEIISKQRIPQLLQAKSLIILTMDDGYEGVYGGRKDQLLYITNQYMFQVPISVHYQRSLLKSKSLSQIKIQFSEKPEIVHFQWTAQYIHLQKIRLLICWNQSEAYVFQTPNKSSHRINLLYVFDKILKKNKLYESDNKVNCFEASLKHRLLLAAFQLGSVKVYKLDQTKKYVCELRGHQRECTGLYIPETTPDLLYSCGLDNCIRIWDLLDFGQIYHVRFDLICSRIQMLNQKLIFAKSIDNRRSFFIKSNIGVLKPILSEAKSGRLVNLASDGEWGVSLYSNNFVQGFLLGQYNNEGRQFTQKIQFPIKYGFLRSTVKIKEENYAICMEKGFSIIKLSKKQSQSQNFQLKRLVYNHTLQSKPNQKGNLIQIIHQKLLDAYFFTILQDWKNIPIAINVTAVSFILNIYIPKWDIQVKAKNNNVKSDYVILGSDRGYIYFVDIKLKSHYHTRVNFHSNTVASVDPITFDGSSNLFFISTTVDQQIVIWELSEQNCPKFYYRLNYTKDVAILKPVNNFMGIGWKSGQFNLFELRHDNEENIQFFECPINKQQGHLKSIVSIDYIFYKGNHLWLTAGEDYAIKMWKGIQRELVIQIRIFSMINCAIFAKRDVDIILSHGQNGQISVIASKYVSQLQQAKKQLETTNLDKCMMMNKIKIKQYLSPSQEEMSPKRKQKDLQKLLKQGNSKKEIGQLIKYRSVDKGIQLVKFPMSDRKQLAKKQMKRSQNFSPVKEFHGQQNNTSLILPKIGSKFSNIHGSARRYQGQKIIKNEVSILQKLETSRLKSYSHAGRLNQ